MSCIVSGTEIIRLESSKDMACCNRKYDYLLNAA